MATMDRQTKTKERVCNMQNVLDRFVGGDYTTDKPGDGYDILRWARAGLITINVEKMENKNDV